MTMCHNRQNENMIKCHIIKGKEKSYANEIKRIAVAQEKDAVERST